MEDFNLVGLVIIFLTAVITAVGTLFIGKLSNRTSKIPCTINSNRIGISANDPILGSISVRYNDIQLRNLHYSVLRIENDSLTDFDNFSFKVYTAEDTLLLNQKTAILDTPYAIPWTDDFAGRMRVPEGGEATQPQLNEYWHSREFNVDVFNRGRILELSFICNKPNDDGGPNIFISSNTKGVAIKYSPNPELIINPIWGVSFRDALPFTTISSLVVFLIVINYIETIWIASLITLIFGLSGNIFGIAILKSWRVLKNIFFR